jgi:hypothetical protein
MRANHIRDRDCGPEVDRSPPSDLEIPVELLASASGIDKELELTMQSSLVTASEVAEYAIE